MSASEPVYSPGAAYFQGIAELEKNTEQKEFLDSTGSCVLLAGPGSGKTKALTLKVARILHEDIRPPRSIACITYSNECVRELKRRLHTLGIDESASIFIGTVHSFCLQHLIRPYAHLTQMNVPDPFEVASQDEETDALDQAAKELRLSRLSAGARTNFRKLRRGSCGFVSGLDPKLVERNERLMEKYVAELRCRGLVDQDDLALLGAELIERHDWVRRMIAAKFPVVVIDEYQDLGLALHRVVCSLLGSKQMRLIAVGDEDQSIYGFTGAQPQLFRQLASNHGCHEIRLNFNYRCGKKIIDAAEIALGKARGYVSQAEQPGLVFEHHRDGGIKDQAEYICEIILPEALERSLDRRHGDVAILYADRHAGDVIAAAAAAKKIRFQRNDKGAPYPKNLTTRWLEDCAGWCSGGWERAEPALQSLLRYWRSLADAKLPRDEKRVRDYRFVRFLLDHRSGVIPLREWLEEFSQAGLKNSFKRRQNKDARDALTKIHAATDPGCIFEGVTVGEFAGYRGSPDHLNLITLHSAKGLEFQVVVLMGMEQGVLPSEHEKEGDEGWYEARRKFYVGLTRAKDEVHMTYSGYVDKWNQRKEFGPSEFLLEVREKIHVD